MEENRRNGGDKRRELQARLDFVYNNIIDVLKINKGER